MTGPRKRSKVYKHKSNRRSRCAKPIISVEDLHRILGIPTYAERVRAGLPDNPVNLAAHMSQIYTLATKVTNWPDILSCHMRQAAQKDEELSRLFSTITIDAQAGGVLSMDTEPCNSNPDANVSHQ